MRSDLIVGVMLTRNRTEMALRAAGDFARQTHGNKSLYVCDNSHTQESALRFRLELRNLERETELNIVYEWSPSCRDLPKLCEKMNYANERACTLLRPQYLAKWDDDDRSARTRLEHQLGTLTATGCRVTGYNELPFVDAESGEVFVYTNPHSSYAIGTSLMMEASAWRESPFPNTENGLGSDTQFVHRWAGKGKLFGTSGFPGGGLPMMIATFHASNSSMTMKTRHKGGFKKATRKAEEQVRRFE